MEPSWLKYIILFGIVQSAFLLLLVNTKKRRIADLFFIGILTILMVLQIEAFLMRLDQFALFVHLMNIATPFIFLLGPLLYLYALGQMDIKLKNPRKLIHFVPFLCYFLYSFNFYLQPMALKYNAAVMGFHPDLELLPVVQTFAFDPWHIQGLVVVELLTLHLLCYCIASFIFIMNLSKENPKLNQRKKEWLLYVTGTMMVGALIMFFSQGGIINGKVFLKSPFPGYSADISSTIAMYFMMIYFLLRPEVYELKGRKYENSSLSKAYKSEKSKKLIALIEDDKLYLNANFSMQYLSEKSGLSAHHISQILNEELQLSFF